MMKKEKKEERFCCGQHTFVLTPKESKCYYQEAIVSSFCLNYDRNRKSRSKNRENCYEGPVFNNDKNCQTHCFVLSSEKKKYLKTALHGGSMDDVKVQNNDEKSYLIPPQPNKRSTYCNVCKERYNDYAQHIRNQSHLVNIRRTAVNQAIKELERKYQEKQRYRLKQKEPTQTVSEFSNIIIIDEDFEGDRSEPIKKVKRDEPIKEYEQGPPEQKYNPLPQNYDIPPPPHTMYSPFLGNIFGSSYPISHLPYLSPPFLNMNINYNFHLLNQNIGNIYPFSPIPPLLGSQALTPHFAPSENKQIHISSEKS